MTNDRFERGDQTIEFETIDYSEFGMLMRPIVPTVDDVLQAGEALQGHIGSQDATLVEFRGQVLRVQTKDVGRCYAVKIDALGAPPE